MATGPDSEPPRRAGRCGPPHPHGHGGASGADAHPTITVGGRPIPVRLRRSVPAQRMSLRIDPAVDGVVLVLPTAVPLAEGILFARARADWITTRLAALPPRRPFQDGARVPVLGVEHVIVHRPKARRGVWIEAGAINVSGLAEHLPRRVRDFLVVEARRTLSDRARALATRVGRPVGRVSLRDTRSRWGSCTARGDLSFCWRLVLAPESVADYVVAHEVAHLVELNHSARFWQVVAGLVGDVASPRTWLRRHGGDLHRYGCPPLP